MRKLVLFALLLISLTGCGDIYRYFKSGDVGWALKKAVRDEHKKEVVLKDLTGFSWDEFFVFDPYTPTSEVCKRLGLGPAECNDIVKTESSDDGVMLIAFRNRGKVVHVELHFRWHGDFTPSPEKPFTPTSAVFNVVMAEGRGAYGGEWLRLRRRESRR